MSFGSDRFVRVIKGLTPAERLVVREISVHYNDVRGYAFVKLRTLAEGCGYSVGYTRRLLAALEVRGVVERWAAKRQQDASQSASDYVLVGYAPTVTKEMAAREAAKARVLIPRERVGKVAERRGGRKARQAWLSMAVDHSVPSHEVVEEKEGSKLAPEWSMGEGTWHTGVDGSGQEVHVEPVSMGEVTWAGDEAEGITRSMGEVTWREGSKRSTNDVEKAVDAGASGLPPTNLCGLPPTNLCGLPIDSLLISCCDLETGVSPLCAVVETRQSCLDVTKAEARATASAKATAKTSSLRSTEVWMERAGGTGLSLRGGAEVRDEVTAAALEAEVHEILMACGWYAGSLADAVRDAIKLEMLRCDRSIGDLGALAVRHWRGFQDELHLMRYPVPPRKFFRDGLWLNPKLWPYDYGKVGELRQRAGASVGVYRDAVVPGVGVGW